MIFLSSPTRVVARLYYIPFRRGSKILVVDGSQDRNLHFSPQT